MAISWDLLDEDCSDMSDWDNLSQGNAVPEVSPAGQFRMDANATDNPNHATVMIDIGSYPNEWTGEIKLYHDALGTNAAFDYFQFEMRRDDFRVYVRFATGGLWVHTGTISLLLADVVKFGGGAAWQIWRFVVKGTVAADATMDIYLDGELVAADTDCSLTGAEVDGQTALTQQGRTTNDMLTHVDYVKIATGLYGIEEDAVNAIVLGANF